MNTLILLLFLGFPGESFSYGYLLIPFGTDGAVFRSALVSDPSSDFSTYYNPSFGLNSRIATFFSSYLVGTKYGGILFTPSRDLTAGVLFFSSGEQDEVTYEGVKVGTYSSTYMALFAGKVLPLDYFGKRAISGFSGKLLYQSIADRKSLAVAIDAGGHIPVNEKILIGASIRNLGVEVKRFYEKAYFPPPSISVGGRVRISGKFQLLFSTGFEVTYGPVFDAGLKVTPLDLLVVEAGYSLKGRELNTGSNLDILNGFATGITLKVKNLRVSYSVLPMGELGLTHYIGVVYR